MKISKYLLAGLIITFSFIIFGFSHNINIGQVKKQPEYKDSELIVKFKKGVAVTKAALAHRAIGAKIKRRLSLINAEHITLQEGTTVEEALKHYKDNPLVEYAEPNYRVRKAVVPNDTYYSNMWHHKKIKSENAWDIATGNSDVIIAVLDTGIDYNHPDLKDNIWRNTNEICGNGVDDDGNGYKDDCVGWDFAYNNNDPMDDDRDGNGSHGTHVAGIIGAVGNNSLGVAGVNWSVKLMAVKVLDNAGSGYISDIVSGINYAKSHNAKIINLSLEATEAVNDINSLKDAIIAARDSNILVISAAGNSGYNLNNINIFPASFRLENLISVAATNSSDILGSYSNYGTNVVHLAAPGSGIISTQSSKAPGFKNYSTAYFYETGTSMAAPMVSGVAGLLLSKNINYSYKDIKELILASVDKINLPVITGGRLNAYKALTLNLSTMSPLKPENLSLAQPLSAGQPVSINWYDLSSVETGYRIERNLKNTGFSLITNLSQNSTSYTDYSANLQEGDKVSYKIYAYNNNGDSEPAQLDLQIPLNKPTQLGVSRVSNGISLNWKDNTNNEDGYEIWRQSGLENYVKIGLVGKDVTTFIDTSLSEATFYYYKVRAYNNQGVYSDYSDEAFIQIVVNKNSSSSSKCFIATATYGTPFHPHVNVLREFRDRVLMKSHIGKAFVSFYYKYSPPIADIVKEHVILRVICLFFILPIVYLIKFPLISAFYCSFIFFIFIYKSRLNKN